jgi:uncharacterized protein (DUF2236 family)
VIARTEHPALAVVAGAMRDSIALPTRTPKPHSRVTSAVSSPARYQAFRPRMLS